MHILGISCFYHDAAAALIHDGLLIAAAQEERFSRKKHDSGFPERAIDFTLRQAGIEHGDLDYVVFYEKPLVKLERILMTTLSTFPRSSAVWREAISVWMRDRLWIKDIIRQKLNIAPDRILFADHHMSHAASAFFTSPFDEAAVLTVDGVGEWTTTALGTAQSAWEDQPGGQNKITLEREQRFPHSLGLLYSAFTAWLGFEVNEGEYKVMGMAPYGIPQYTDKVYQTFSQADDGAFRLNMPYFDFHHSIRRTFSGRFIELFGAPRIPESPFITPLTTPGANPNDSAVKQSQYYADIAASIQHVTEEALLKIARVLHQQTGQKYLVMAGGVALNSVANYRILQETPFEDVYIQPAAGDDGGALGAALWAYHIVLNQPRRRESVMRHTYYGEDYSEAQIQAAITQSGLKSISLTDTDQLVARAVEEIAEGRVAGLFQGRFEWGPRALGNRSILADPRRESMKETVNAKVKFREPFRPFAPVVTEADVADYFQFPNAAQHLAARFMLMVSPVTERGKQETPATTHAGGTGRLQVIDPHTNPVYYNLVSSFGALTGTPVLLNTSFNLRGEPIVATPEDALKTFCASGLDLLLIPPFLVQKG